MEEGKKKKNFENGVATTKAKGKTFVELGGGANRKKREGLFGVLKSGITAVMR